MCSESSVNERSFYWDFFAIKGVFKSLSVLLLYLPIDLKCNPSDLIDIIDKEVPAFPM